MQEQIKDKIKSLQQSKRSYDKAHNVVSADFTGEIFFSNIKNPNKGK